MGRNVAWGDMSRGETSQGEMSRGETSFGEKRRIALSKVPKVSKNTKKVLLAQKAAPKKLKK